MKEKTLSLELAMVFMLNQKFEKRDVELGISDGIIVEVKSGISESDKIKVWNKTQGFAQN